MFFDADAAAVAFLLAADKDAAPRVSCFRLFAAGASCKSKNAIRSSQGRARTSGMLTVSSSLWDVNEELGPVRDLSTGRSFLFSEVGASGSFLAGADADEEVGCLEEEATTVEAEFEVLVVTFADELDLAPFSAGRAGITPEARSLFGREAIIQR